MNISTFPIESIKNNPAFRDCISYIRDIIIPSNMKNFSGWDFYNFSLVSKAWYSMAIKQPYAITDYRIFLTGALPVHVKGISRRGSKTNFLKEGKIITWRYSFSDEIEDMEPEGIYLRCDSCLETTHHNELTHTQCKWCSFIIGTRSQPKDFFS